MSREQKKGCSSREVRAPKSPVLDLKTVINSDDIKLQNSSSNTFSLFNKIAEYNIGDEHGKYLGRNVLSCVRGGLEKSVNPKMPS
ncbi:hypothetical protein CEXT_719401 [Caerostris extrusa]|uniref:Uncharacterized protein n=1 Tax=Caerostris extrusa TaxID=172846 RepID=A0AAV4RRR2_CAEEX|nr:hypothetical protein CEXT_719401 [Caerostris extrusa]